jgi:hypothetical protein
MYWHIVPDTYPADVTGNAASVAVLVTVAGFWSALNSWQLVRLIRGHARTGREEY